MRDNLLTLSWKAKHPVKFKFIRAGAWIIAILLLPFILMYLIYLMFFHKNGQTTIIRPTYYYHHVQRGAYKYRGCAKSVQTSAGKVYRVYQQCTTCKHSVRYTYRPVIYCSLQRLPVFVPGVPQVLRQLQKQTVDRGYRILVRFVN